MIDLLFNHHRIQKEWGIFAKSFNLCQLKRSMPVVVGNFNGVDMQVDVRKYKGRNASKHFTRVTVPHTNGMQQRIRIVAKKAFPKLSLVHRINENLGYSYNDHDFTRHHIIYSETKLKNNLPRELHEGFETLIRHELRINKKEIVYNEPGMIDNHNRLIDVCYFMTELAKEVSENNFNQLQEVMLR